MRKHRLGDIIITETLNTSFLTSESESVLCVQYLTSLEQRVEGKLERLLIEFRADLPKVCIGQVIDLTCTYPYVDNREFVICGAFTRLDAWNIDLTVNVVIAEWNQTLGIINEIRKQADTLWIQ